ncbi:MAG TPA: DUF6364 family protein [Bacteroidia bacterium]|nr:hypothetical protein [Bacteroidota bacterium]MBL0051316.1 hypothetical protein [Bacteroidota bacterium]HRC31811.1 DUF6364 family protein [Bacteroidia bacterium]
METKLTLRFDSEIIDEIKRFAESKNISVSKLTEYLFTKVTAKNYKSLEDFPIAKWIDELAEPQIKYTKPGKKKKSIHKEFYESKATKK